MRLLIVGTLIFFISTVQSIMNGYNATIDQFPYHTFIRVHYDLFIHSPTKVSCMGAVITSRIIITSYYCVQNGLGYEVSIGSLNPFDNHRPLYFEITRKRFYAPPKAFTSDPSTIRSYIALLPLEVEIIFNNFIKPVGLPLVDNKPSDVVDVPYTYYNANVTGYLDNYLKWIHMVVVPILECKNTFKEERNIEEYVEDSLCAGSVDHNGDERGSLCDEANSPLVANNTLLGFLKLAMKRCETGGFHLFTEIAPDVNWINKTESEILSGQVTFDAIKNEFPYHAHIEVNGAEHLNIRNCSGAVVTSKFVITSNDCVWNGTSFRIRIGSLNPGKVDDNPEYDHVTHMLPAYPTNPIDTIDLQPSLLLMEEEIPFNSHIQPILLPEPNTVYFYTIVSGYYSDERDHLKWSLTEIHNNNRFRRSLFSAPLRVKGLNAADSGRLCKEGGAPLVLNSDRRTLVGIFAARDYTCEGISDRTLHLFIDVASYVSWINETVNEPNKHFTRS